MIDVWKSWYDGDVKKFHTYTVFNGQSHIQCHRYTLGMGKKVAEDWANLLMNEKVKITLEGEKEQAFFDDVCRSNNFDVKANEMQEMKSGLGTTAYVARVTGVNVKGDTGVITGGGTLKLDYVTAQNIFPLSWENGFIKECAFSSSIAAKGKKYVYLQLHRIGADGNYIIENSVYYYNDLSITEAPLSEIPGFENVPPVVNTGSPYRQFVIDRLNIANNVDNTLPMGISAFANAIDQLKGVDIAYDSYVNEFVLGKKRIMVQPAATKTLEGEPVFDKNELVYYVLPEDIGDGSVIQPIDMTLRTAEHNAGLQDMLNALSSRCGFGKNYYKFDNGSIATATQVISENQDLQSTVHKHGIILKSAMEELARIILRLGNSVLGMSLDEDTEIKVELDDSIFVDRESMLNDMRNDVAAGLLKGELYVAEKYGVTVEQAREMMPRMDEIVDEEEEEIE